MCIHADIVDRLASRCICGVQLTFCATCAAIGGACQGLQVCSSWAQPTQRCLSSGAGKRVMGGGGPMSQTAQQAELKLEQMVDQRDMAIANAGVNGDAGIETITNQEILPISEVLLCILALTRRCQEVSPLGLRSSALWIFLRACAGDGHSLSPACTSLKDCSLLVASVHKRVLKGQARCR